MLKMMVIMLNFDHYVVERSLRDPHMNNSFLVYSKLETVSSRSGGDNTAAIVGGVLGTVTVPAIMGMMIVVVIILRNHGALHFTGMRKYVLYNMLCTYWRDPRALHS